MWKIFRFRSLLKTGSLLSLVLGVLLVLGGCQERPELTERVPTQNRQAEVVGEVDATQDADLLKIGEEVFNRMCAVCHGTRGSGRGTRPGPSLQRADFDYGRTPEAVKMSIRDGRPGGMPFFHHALSDEELEAVTLYVLSLGQ
ncbi:cytochrome c oxidase, cbb3-type, subunit III [Geoalkalibacter ferrihydriticus]|uniref:Cytochrome c oxidase, cbb3-type, subunit III n=1 Tax=Geoalkalibacter ferrihydriticus TaxID=392333 RepID=A0A1G9SHT8_9BACT|nr:cytochrome c oxidase, cbb3-type, subunit III [Geoalkalibacter ferrihydriticus]